MNYKPHKVLDILFSYNTEELSAIDAHDQLYDFFSNCSKKAREHFWGQWEIRKSHNFASEQDRVFAVEVLDEVISDSDPESF